MTKWIIFQEVNMSYIFQILNIVCLIFTLINSIDEWASKYSKIIDKREINSLKKNLLIHTASIIAAIGLLISSFA